MVVLAEISENILHINLKKDSKEVRLSIPLFGSNVIDLKDELVMTYFVDNKLLISDQFKIESIIKVFPEE